MSVGVRACLIRMMLLMTNTMGMLMIVSIMTMKMFAGWVMLLLMVTLICF